MQEEELKFAKNPHPLFSTIYKNEWYEGLNFETVRGDSEIISGIDVLLTPGHTAGAQSVSITTKQGKVVIVGSCVIDDNFSDKGVIIAGSNTDPLKAYESMMRIREVADTIVPLHSQRMLNVKSIP